MMKDPDIYLKIQTLKFAPIILIVLLSVPAFFFSFATSTIHPYNLKFYGIGEWINIYQYQIVSVLMFISGVWAYYIEKYRNLFNLDIANYNNRRYISLCVLLFAAIVYPCIFVFTGAFKYKILTVFYPIFTFYAVGKYHTKSTNNFKAIAISLTLIIGFIILVFVHYKPLKNQSSIINHIWNLELIQTYTFCTIGIIMGLQIENRFSNWIRKLVEFIIDLVGKPGP